MEKIKTVHLTNTTIAFFLYIALVLGLGLGFRGTGTKDYLIGLKVQYYM